MNKSVKNFMIFFVLFVLIVQITSTVSATNIENNLTHCSDNGTNHTNCTLKAVDNDNNVVSNSKVVPTITFYYESHYPDCIILDIFVHKEGVKATGEYSIKLGDISTGLCWFFDGFLHDGQASVIVAKIPAGVYDINISYGGNKNFTYASIKDTVIVNPFLKLNQSINNTMATQKSNTSDKLKINIDNYFATSDANNGIVASNVQTQTFSHSGGGEAFTPFINSDDADILALLHPRHDNYKLIW